MKLKKRENVKKTTINGKTFYIGYVVIEGVEIITLKDEEGNIWVALKVIVEALGLNWASQTRKLKKLAEEKGIALKTIPLQTKGGIQEAIMINLYHLPAFLYSIQPSRVKPELKEKLIKFQRETTKVINDYWNKGAVINPRVEENNLKAVIQEAIKEYEKERNELVLAQMEKFKIQKSELARRYIATLKDLDFIDERYLKRLAEFGMSLLTGDVITEKQQITVEEFLKSKKIYDKGLRTSFGLFLSKFYKKKTGRKPKKALTIINGKEIFTNYYTLEDLAVLEEAFQEWSKNKIKEIKALKG